MKKKEEKNRVNSSYGKTKNIVDLINAIATL